MAYYWTVNKGPCACCGSCPALYVTVQGTQTSLTQSGSSWSAEWNIPVDSLNGIAVPAMYLDTAQFVYFVKRSSTNFFPGTGWYNWLCVANNQITLARGVTLDQTTTQANLWTDVFGTFVFVCDSSKFSAAESAFQANLAANIAKTMGTLTTI